MNSRMIIWAKEENKPGEAKIKFRNGKTNPSKHEEELY